MRKERAERFNPFPFIVKPYNPEGHRINGQSIMEKLSNKILRYADTEYNHAVNYRHMYNAPVTVNYGPKHGRKKYIISAGTSDHIEIWEDGIFLYVIAQNNGLSYIGMDVINTEAGEIDGQVFLNEEDCTDPGHPAAGILDKDSQEQIKILCEYL